MALKKDIKLENGVVLSYHRIITLQLVTNKYINIIVGSYVSEESRKEDFLDDKLIETDVVTIDKYIENFNIEKAYEILKTTKKYKDAVDV